MKTDTLTFVAEYMDTMNGESNCSWIRQARFEMPQDASELAILRRAKKEIGISGMRGERFDCGGEMEFRPYGVSAVMYVRIE